MAEQLRIGALISGGGTNLQAIIDACEAGKLDGKVVFVGSDQPGAKGLERAEKHGIPHFVVEYASMGGADGLAIPDDCDLAHVMVKQRLFSMDAPPEKVERFFRARAASEAGLLEQMDKHGWDLLVLAGFMRVLSPYFIDRVNRGRGLPRIMNIHPALLPAFPGLDGYGDTFAYGCKVGGCTVHFVDYGEDSGPIIGQMAYAVDPGDTEDSIRRKGLELEWALYPECIQLYAQNRLRLAERRGRTVVEVLP